MPLASVEHAPPYRSGVRHLSCVATERDLSLSLSALGYAAHSGIAAQLRHFVHIPRDERSVEAPIQRSSARCSSQHALHQLR